MPRLPCLFVALVLLAFVGCVGCTRGAHRDTEVRVYGPFAVGEEATLTIWRTDVQPDADTCSSIDSPAHPCDKRTWIHPRIVSVDCDDCTVLATNSDAEHPTVSVSASQPGAHTVGIELEDPDGARSTAEVDVHFGIPDHVELSRAVTEPLGTAEAVIVGTSFRWRPSLQTASGRTLSTRWAVDTGDGTEPTFGEAGAEGVTFTVSRPGLVAVTVRSHDGTEARRTLRVLAASEIASASLHEVDGLPFEYDLGHVPLETPFPARFGPALGAIVAGPCGGAPVYALRLRAKDGTTVYAPGTTLSLDPPSLARAHAFPGADGPFLGWTAEAEGEGYLRGTLGTLSLAIPVRSTLTCAAR